MTDERSTAGRAGGPPAPDARPATRLAWGALAFQTSAVIVVFLAMGSSAAMKAAWIEDAIGLLPPVAFLVAQRVRTRAADERFPWGYGRATTVAFLSSATALLLFGLLILQGAASTLLSLEHTTIGTRRVFGHLVWAGWPMVAAMAYTTVPPVLLGLRIVAVARDLEDTSLHSLGAMLRADALTAAATSVGVLGVGFGLWWLDPLVALGIGLDVTRDGIQHLRGAVSELMDQRPMTVDHDELDELPDRLLARVRRQDWVAAADARFREHGQHLVGEVRVVPAAGLGGEVASRLTALRRDLLDSTWRLADVAVVAVHELPDAWQRSADG